MYLYVIVYIIAYDLRSHLTCGDAHYEGAHWIYVNKASCPPPPYFGRLFQFGTAGRVNPPPTPPKKMNTVKNNISVFWAKPTITGNLPTRTQINCYSPPPKQKKNSADLPPHFGTLFQFGRGQSPPPIFEHCSDLGVRRGQPSPFPKKLTLSKITFLFSEPNQP